MEESMKRSVCLAVAGFMLLLPFATASAGDLAIVTLNDRLQATQAQGILGTAFTRDGNRFLAEVSDDQVRALDAAGIKYEIVMDDIDPDGVFMVRHSDSRTGIGVDVPRLGETVSLGMDAYAVRLSPSVARSLARSTELTAVALSERSIPIRFVDPAIATTLSQLTDFPTDSLCDLVNQDSIYAMNLRLENFRTRYIFTDSILAARDWMIQKFLDWGYTDITTPSFTVSGWPCYNIKVVKPGYAEPDKVIVIGGHYDAVTYGQPTDPMDYAPGADDDGSGTTITLEMARILKDIPLRKTVIFMPFSAEEEGLYGSYDAAYHFYNDGTDLEVMFNYDMVGFNESQLWGLDVASGTNGAYKYLAMNACYRVNPRLIPIESPVGSSSDHASFMDFGFNIVDNIEDEFNYDGWHTDIDWTSRMDFDFMYEVARMAVASLAIVANAAHPTEIDHIVDQGDGQSLEVFWTSCDGEYIYKLYYGAVSGVYTDSVDIPAGNCSWVVDGLNVGQPYYFTVVGEVAGGYPAVYAVEGSGTPYVVPRPPTQVQAGPDFHRVLIDWADNQEADFSHYRLYRSVGGLPYTLYQDNVLTSDFVDTEVIGQVEYSYEVTAVDFDGYESDVSAQVSAYAATFDGGILLVDETRQGGGMPTQATQEALFSSWFDPTPFDIVQIETSGERLSRNRAGQYSSIFWVDDDFSPKLIRDSEDSLDWYAGFTGNIFVDGFRTLEYWEQSPLSSGDVLYKDFRVASYTVHEAFDFAGAAGVGGWPDIQVDTTAVLGYLPFIPTIGMASGGQPIYLYDSKTDDPASEGTVCGVYYDSPNGKRVVLGFPLMFLTDESAVALMNYAKNLFGESASSEVNGDVDNSGHVDIGDLVYLVDYMFLQGPPPWTMNSADVDASCRVDISDLIYLIDYIFLSGPAPQAGCVE